MSTPDAVFHPPYLKQQIPAEAALIQQKIAAVIAESRAKRPAHKPDTTVAHAEASNLHATAIKTPNVSGIKVGATTAKQPQPGNQTGGGLRSTPIAIDVTPNGTVNMGFNCKKTFIASNNFGADTCYWEIHFKNLSTGNFDQVQFMGHTSTLTTHKHTVQFDMDFDTYNNATYVSPLTVNGGGMISGGLATFKVLCMGYNYAVPIWNGGLESIPGPQCFSDEITLDFNGEHCIIINSLSLSADTFRGGQNDKEPTMTVNVSAPAPPGGLVVALDVSNHNLGNIMGSGWFTIAPGQTSGSISWFLGTRRVYVTGRKLDIIAKLSFPDGSTSPSAYATVTLNKQKH